MRLLKTWFIATVTIATAVVVYTAIATRPALAPGPPVGAATPWPSPAATVEAPPSPTPTPVPLLGRVAKLTAMPTDPHYFAEGGSDTPRILLFDAASTRPPIEVVAFDPAPAPAGPDVRSIAFDASADGRVLVVARRVAEQRTVFYLVRPEAGTIALLFEDTSAIQTRPIVSADGARFAYSRLGDAATTGVWIADAGDRPSPKRLVASDPQVAGSPPQPVSWAPDGGRLAISFGGEGGRQLAIVDVPAETTFDPRTNEFRGGSAVMVGPGFAIDWRKGDKSLLVTSSRSAFGGRSYVYLFDLSAKQSRELYVPAGDTIIDGAGWDPARLRFFVHEVPFGGGANRVGTVWLLLPDGTGSKAAEGLFAAPWWSRDGSRLWTLGLGDDSTGLIRDILSSDALTYCRRNPSPPCS